MVSSPSEPDYWWTVDGQNKGPDLLHQPQAASLDYDGDSELQSRSLEIQ